MAKEWYRGSRAPASGGTTHLVCFSQYSILWYHRKKRRLPLMHSYMVLMNSVYCTVYSICSILHSEYTEPLTRLICLNGNVLITKQPGTLSRQYHMLQKWHNQSLFSVKSLQHLSSNSPILLCCNTPCFFTSMLAGIRFLCTDPLRSAIRHSARHS